MTIQELIKHLNSLGNTASMIAIKAKVSRGTPYDWLSGKTTTIQSHNAKALADAYGFRFELDDSGIMQFTALDTELQTLSQFIHISETLNPEGELKSIPWHNFSGAKISNMSKIIYKISRYDDENVAGLESILK